MPNKFSSGKFAIAQCDRCDFRYKLTELRTEIIKTKPYQLKVCKTCWDPDQPQLQLGMYPINDPQAVREPRPDISYYASGVNGVQTQQGGGVSPNQAGYPDSGSRVFQWGYAPVGGSSGFDRTLTPNYLVGNGNINSVTITQE